MRPRVLRLHARHGALNDEILIAGAGIGGLAAAVALARAGARVTVLERRPAPAEFGAGLQISPNATRVLARLGLLDRLRDLAVEPHAIRVRRGRDGADLLRIPLGAQAAARYQAPFLLVLRPALQRLLLSEAESEPRIDIRFGVDVRSAAADPSGAAAVSTAAGPLRADGFVDARGVGATAARHTGRIAWRALVPRDALADDPSRPETNLWLGVGTHLVHYPLPGNDRINVVAVTDGPASGAEADADLWSRPGDPEALGRAFAGWCPEARRCLDPRVEWRRWPLLDAAPLARWSHGPLTVLGDAAHPMVPFLAQGASQAIEDAGCLAASLSESPDVASAFALYEDRRRGRATRVQDASRRQARIYHLARPASDARDLTMRLLGGARAQARMDWLYAEP